MALTCKTPEDVLKVCKDQGVEMVDFRFTDVPGTWQHLTVPVDQLVRDTFTDGRGFDGSSIRGFQAIQESDMLVIPDPTSAFLDPFTRVPTLVLVCDIKDPVTGAPYSRDPRYVGKKAEAYLKSTGIADTVYFGPEPEFFTFNDVRYGYNAHSGYFFVDSDEGIWNSGRVENGRLGTPGDSRNLANKIRHKEGYFPAPPVDTQLDLRSEMVQNMINAGIEVELHHHEVATAGQAEIDMRFDTLVRMADKLMMYKYMVKNTAWKHGMTATFMPKPLFEDNGSGMHCHQSLWKAKKPLFFGASDYAGLSELARHYIGGLLKHAPSILAIAAPTTNSYHRLVPGYEAPINLVYSMRNRSACCRIPMYSNSPNAKRVEFRSPDPACNGYLAFAAMMMAGVDGIQNKIDPGKPMDKNMYDLPPAEAKKVKATPGSLNESLDALEEDNAYLLKGDVFTTDLIEAIIERGRRDVDLLRLRPHPYEYHLYYDC